MNNQLIVLTATLALSLAAPLEDGVYDGCGTNYGCFGMPSGCVSAKACNVLVTYVQENGAYKIDLHHYNTNGPSDNYYAAVGFSNDNKMADSAIYECVTNGKVRGVTAYAEKPQRPTKQIIDAIDTVSVAAENGGLRCTFTAKPNVVAGASTFNLDGEIYLLMSQGLVQDGQIQKHDKVAVSPNKVKLSDNQVIESLPLLNLNADIKPAYDNCNKDDTRCLGIPPNKGADCIKDANCLAVVQFKPIKDSKKVEFHVYRQVPIDQKNVNYWVGMGLSRDDKMADSAVVECIRNNDKPIYKTAYAATANLPAEVKLENVAVDTVEFGDDFLHCHIVIDDKTSAKNGDKTSEFKLSEDLHLILAMGPYNAEKNQIDKHTNVIVSPDTYKLEKNASTKFQISAMLLFVAAIFATKF